MARTRLIWQLYPAFLLVIFITLATVAVLSFAMEEMYLRIAAGGAVSLAVSALVSWALAHRIVRPLEAMKLEAARFAAGEVSRPMPLPEAQEMAELAEAMNGMARQLDERIRTATEQRNEREAILSSMMEGVIAVDQDQRIISMNRAAADMLDADPALVQGKSIRHAVRNRYLIGMMAEARQTAEPASRELVLQAGGRECVVQAHAAALRSADGSVIGVVMVLDDITGLRKLERVRSDFVANVSHELKTPITSIKGFVETLLEGEPSEEDRRRFLEIVAKQADRLNAIIQDLLTLSRIEQDEEDRESILSTGALLPVVQSAAQLCAGTAAGKEVRITVSCPAWLRARINAPLLEQGLTNLIDNAVKYTEAGGEVRIEVAEHPPAPFKGGPAEHPPSPFKGGPAEHPPAPFKGGTAEHPSALFKGGSAAGEIAISVIDRGCGIPAEHLPRLFERFYRVDKARSRQLGGTGLGLAIVKHIAQTHGGRIEVESKPGAGSTFRVVLPALDASRQELGMVV